MRRGSILAVALTLACAAPAATSADGDAADMQVWKHFSVRSGDDLNWVNIADTLRSNRKETRWKGKAWLHLDAAQRHVRVKVKVKVRPERVGGDGTSLPATATYVVSGGSRKARVKLRFETVGIEEQLQDWRFVVKARDPDELGGEQQRTYEGSGAPAWPASGLWSFGRGQTPPRILAPVPPPPEPEPEPEPTRPPAAPNRMFVGYAGWTFYGARTLYLLDVERELWEIVRLADEDTFRPILLPESVDADAVLEYSVGSTHQLALLSDGRVLSAGPSTWGQLGREQVANASKLEFRLVEGIEDAVGCSAGGEVSFFWNADGDVWACGRNDKGQLGDGTTQSRERVVQVSTSGVVDVAVGGAHTVFLHGDGTVSTCGSSEYGALGDGRSGSDTHTTVPTHVSGLTDVASVYGYVDGSLARLDNGTLMVWGSFIQTTSTPEEFDGPIFGDLVSLTDGASSAQVFGYDADADQWWGLGSDLFLQTSGSDAEDPLDPTGLSRLNVTEPLLMKDLDGFRSVATGFFRSAGISADGRIFEWGAGEPGFREIVLPTK